MGQIVKSFNVNDFEVLTDTGFEDIKYLHKTIPYDVIVVETETLKIECSFNHLFFDENMNEVFTYDLSIGDKIQTINGFESVISINIIDVKNNMYDLELNNINKRYYTNDILSHNTSVGKTSSMLSMTSNFLRNNKDVLYITLEMAEEKIAQRVDANFLDVDINDVPLMDKNIFNTNIKKIREKTKGRLVIKEYPPATISTSKIRFLLDELKIKLGFEPKIIVVDYLNLLLSDRIKGDNMYSIVKSIAEELRGLAVEKDLCILSATQGNRQTNDENNSDLDITNVSESIGLPATVDALVGIIFPAELREQNIQIWKILKNRFGGIVNHKIPLKVNFARAGLYDIDTTKEFNISGNDVSNNIQMKTESHRLEKKNKIIVDDIESSVEDDLLDLMN